MSRYLVLTALLAGCAPGDATVLVTVTSTPTISGADHLQARVGNGTLTATPLTFALAGAPVTLPPARSFSLIFDPAHHGSFDINVAVLGNGATLATGCVGSDVEPSRALTAQVQLGYRAGCDPSGWSVFPGATTMDLHGLWGSSASDVWCAADAGTLLHWDGSGGWSRITLPTSAVLRGLWGSAANDVWAVGDAGTVLHWNGQTWATQPSGTTVQLEAVWGNGAGDLWVVGYTGVVLHAIAGGNLAPVLNSAGKNLSMHDLFGVWGGSGEIWLVGAAGTLLHFDGASWLDQSLGMQDLVGVWGVDAQHVFVVGGTGTFLTWNGLQWTQRNGPQGNFYAVWGRSAADVWAVGAAGIITHFDGNAWLQSPGAGLSPNSNDLNAIWGSATGEVWSVGSSGILLRH